ncbi:hypothetical protein [Engelhardtia mirabilis]|uniref:Uncharacterized protein n=1 Tax=Engelhardtia mirabilis TaxID=2528011 RepID=A0A518BG28_9BACT|nr:hypothetical protein Pla133_10080 [Planctomycetes bacterium Pla133]QDV00268.1 hypothetical protein Pla86_10070 [Planctomycetes bacterium Pla86]
MILDANRSLTAAAGAAGLALLSGCSAMGVARDPVTPQRPTFSNDTRTTGFGSFEIEAGAELDPSDRYGLETRVSIGLSESSEFFVGWLPYQNIDARGVDVEGPGDVRLGWKQRLMDETEELPATAIQLSTSLPAGEEEPFISSGFVDFYGAIIADRTFGRLGLTGFYQLGILGTAVPGDNDTEHTFSLGGTWAYDDLWNLGLETAVIYEPEIGENPFLGTAYAQYKLSEFVVVDGGVRLGLNADADDFILFVGMTTNLGRYF